MPRGISLYKSGEALGIAGSDLLDFASELLALGVLKESDWLFKDPVKGDIARNPAIKSDLQDAIECGMHRWINDELGAKDLQVFGKLRFEYFNDARSYFKSLDDKVWRGEMHALPHRPIGFFGFSWQQDGFDPVFVAERVTELEAAFPGVGYGLCDMLGYAFRWSVNGLGFDASFDAAEESEESLHAEWLERELADAGEDDLDEGGNPPEESFLSQILEERWTDMLAESNETHLTTVRYHQIVPEQAHTTRMNSEALPAACREIEGVQIRGFRDGRAVGTRRINNSKLTPAQRAKRQYKDIIQKIMDLHVLLNSSSRTHVGADHLALIKNNGAHIYKNHTVYLAWHPEDETHRIADDMNELAFRRGGCDLVWAKGFQLAHKGVITGAARMQQDMMGLMRPDMVPGFDYAGDGSLAAAVAGVRRFIEIARLTDQILQWLHTPQQHMEPRDELRVRAYA